MSTNTNNGIVMVNDSWSTMVNGDTPAISSVPSANLSDLWLGQLEPHTSQAETKIVP